MTGAGDSAGARAAGYAGAQVARHNLDQRLSAAGQLSGPTGMASLSSAANPYIGQSQTNQGTTTQAGTNFGTSSNTGSTSNTGQTNTSGATTGFNDLLGTSQTSGQGSSTNNTTGSQITQDSTAGNAGSSSGAQAAGQIPEGQTVSGGGGGCIVCTAGIERGLWKNKRILRKVVSHKLDKAYGKFKYAATGYFLLFTPFAKALLTTRSSWLTGFAMFIAKMVVYEELRVAGRRLPLRLGPWFTHWAWHILCHGVGRLKGNQTGVTDPTLISVAKKHEVFFNLGGPTK
jgi:hypothetical protein